MFARLLDLEHHAAGRSLAVREDRRSDIVMRGNLHRGYVLAVPSGTPLKHAPHQFHLASRTHTHEDTHRGEVSAASAKVVPSIHYLVCMR